MLQSLLPLYLIYIYNAVHISPVSSRTLRIYLPIRSCLSDSLPHKLHHKKESRRVRSLRVPSETESLRWYILTYRLLPILHPEQSSSYRRGGCNQVQLLLRQQAEYQQELLSLSISFSSYLLPHIIYSESCTALHGPPTWICKMSWYSRKSQRKILPVLYTS